jgi:hypothetical protein
MASIAVSVVAKAVIMMTTQSGALSLTVRSSSRPDAPFIWTSEMTTSKSSASSATSASSTLAAVVIA